MTIVPKSAHTGLRFFFVIILAALFLLTEGSAGIAAQEGPTIGPSGLPVPRYISLGSDKINVRTGPGKQYPIDWVYVRKGLPVKVIAEYDIWRKILDHDGSTGWIHGSLLSGRRTVLIEKGIQTIYTDPDPKSWPVLRAQSGVIAELRRCNRQWCEIQIDGKKGWVPRAGLWGTTDWNP